MSIALAQNNWNVSAQPPSDPTHQRKYAVAPEATNFHVALYRNLV